ncbi:MAG: cystathionine beta-synthase [Saprospiraceae bacterium]|jgi:cystathionine beta-synthase
MRYNNILEAIGNTPLIRLNKITQGIRGTVYAKMEAMNPGLSAKDRIAIHMIDKAEKEGRLLPGGTIIEATSGNTGFSIAMISAIRGYRCMLTVTSKISQEKINLLKAMGARVILCPKSVQPDDPRSYYQRAIQLANDTPNSLYLNQNFNSDNVEAHYMSTGPEIWKQTEGKITHLLCSTGTGGTLSGTAKYLKEQNPDIQVVAIDAYGSVLKKYFETGINDPNEVYPYLIEGTGKNIIPDNVRFEYIDRYVKVTDKNSAFKARRLAKQEGLLVGYSSGAVMQGLFEIRRDLKNDDLAVLIFADHGSRYLGKIFNDEWMEEQGFLYGSSNYKYMLRWRKFLRSI